MHPLQAQYKKLLGVCQRNRSTDVFVSATPQHIKDVAHRIRDTNNIAEPKVCFVECAC